MQREAVGWGREEEREGLKGKGRQRKLFSNFYETIIMLILNLGKDNKQENLILYKERYENPQYKIIKIK